MDLNRKILSDIVVYSKYARYLPEENRRETWDEIVTRNMEMHIRKFPHIEDEIRSAYEYVYRKEVLPSMRSLQFGGRPIEANPARIYNCSFLHVDDYRAFSETMFLLLCGTGVGYSVQNRHIEKLPPIRKPLKKRRFLVGDSIEGWADAVKALVKSYMLGSSFPVFDFSDVRPKGALLITSGGKAPGPEPLKECLFHIQKIFDRKSDGEQLSSLECHDILCYIADAVLAGGIRRSAMIALFDMDDKDMLTSKFGDWYIENPQRGRANNSVVLVRHKMKNRVEFDKIFKAVEESKAGEPGIFWTNDANLGTNPCLDEDTWIKTNVGHYKIKDLINANFDYKIVVDGKNYKTLSDGFFKTGTKEVFELSTNEGFKVNLTADHKVRLASGDWIEAKNLVPGDQIRVHNHRQAEDWGGENGTDNEGYLLGLLVGDGTFDDNAIICVWEDESGSEHAIMRKVSSAIEHMPKRSDFLGFRKKEKQFSPFSEYRCRIASVTALAKKFNIYRGHKVVTEEVEKASFNFYKGFLRGFFDADGSVMGNQTKGISVRLSQINLNNLEAVQRMLARLGIFSTIYKRKEAHEAMMPDGHGGERLYESSTLYELVITAEDLIRYRDLIGFEHTAKMSRLNDLIENYKRKPNRTDFSCAFKSLTSLGEKDVYDVTVDDVHAFDANGLYVHNCGEISLHTNQFCNLCEINASDIRDQEDYENRVRAASLIGTLQTSYTDFHYLRDIWKKTTEKEALLGIGMTGVASGAVLNLDMEAAAKVAVIENERVSKLLDVNKAARITTLKPSGTSSLVVGSSSGVHAWHNDYYIRRMRLGKNESIYKYLLQNNPELLEDEYFKPHLQAVVSIPIKAPPGSILRTESPIDTLERVKDLQLKWILPGHIKGQNTHNVSCTISIKDDEWLEVGNWMWDNREFYTGISVLPYDGGTYIQAPHEDITEEEYLRLTENLKDIDLSNIIEVEDLTDLSGELACAGGACSIDQIGEEQSSS